jgi:hypothetical protein
VVGRVGGAGAPEVGQHGVVRARDAGAREARVCGASWLGARGARGHGARSGCTMGRSVGRLDHRIQVMDPLIYHPW